MLQPAVHRAILIVDVERFGDPIGGQRPPAGRARWHVSSAAAILLQRPYQLGRLRNRRPRGRRLVLVPPVVPKSWLVTRLPGYLAEALVRHNAAHPEQERIRLRMALHAGEVHQDPHGFAGVSINRAFRLIEAPASRTALRDSSGVVALIVSDWFYDEVVRHHPAAGPSCFRQVHVVMKETEMTAWVRVLESGGAARRAIPAGSTGIGSLVSPDPRWPITAAFSAWGEVFAAAGCDGLYWQG